MQTKHRRSAHKVMKVFATECVFIMILNKCLLHIVYISITATVSYDLSVNSLNELYSNSYFTLFFLYSSHVPRPLSFPVAIDLFISPTDIYIYVYIVCCYLTRVPIICSLQFLIIYARYLSP